MLIIAITKLRRKLYIELVMQNFRLNSNGVTLLELILVIAILSIVLSIAIPYVFKYKSIYTFQEYKADLETTVKWAKMKAMENSTNTAVCSNQILNSIKVYNKGTNRDYPCDGNGALIYTINLDKNIAVVKDGGFSFDPRGLGIVGGTICFQSKQSSSSYFAVSVQNSSGYIDISSGSGNCK
jgi:prepilin-type N-terminal cleavage/methylation domain-containing protein